MSRPRGLAAAAALLRLPLRATRADGASLGEALERGYLAGVAECARLLAAELGSGPDPARAFGGEWLVVERDGLLLAPGLPAPLSSGSSAAPDATYRRDAASVWRESGGGEVLVLTAEPGAPAPGGPFDLLWFGEAERYLLLCGRLTVDDLFSDLRVWPSRTELERLLVRVRRADPTVLAGLGAAGDRGPAEITVRRPLRLSAVDRWRDPERFLACRADIGLVAAEGDALTATTVHGSTVVFRLEEGAAGWRATVVAGEYPFRALELAAQGELLALTGTIAPGVDPLAPGMRSRLAFDLRSDLVVLG